jgi:hypothetical protein
LNKQLPESVVAYLVPDKIGLKRLGDIQDIDEKTKLKIYNLIKEILIDYDKCNYIIGINRYELPFPYAEVLSDGLMCFIIVGLIIYSFSKFAPIHRVVELKDLYEYQESAQTLVNDPTFVKEITTKMDCHNEDVKSVMIAVKAIMAVSIIVFMIIYSIKIMNSTRMYKYGLATSSFMAKSKCC